jgi:hypothetical protein
LIVDNAVHFGAAVADGFASWENAPCSAVVEIATYKNPLNTAAKKQQTDTIVA